MRTTNFFSRWIFSRNYPAVVAVVVLSMGIGAFAMGGIESYASPAATDENIIRIPVADFDKIEARDVVNIIYRQGNFPGYIEVESLPVFTDNLDVKEKDGVLILGCRTDNENRDFTLTVKVTAPRLSELKMSGVAAFEAEGPFRIQDTINIKADEVSQVNFGEVMGRMMKIDTKGVAKVYVLAAELEILGADADECSSLRLKGLNVDNIVANAFSTADITLGGRCRMFVHSEDAVANINRKGLIIETPAPIAKKSSSTPPTSTPTRQP